MDLKEIEGAKFSCYSFLNGNRILALQWLFGSKEIEW
jgi:hypothetical protein